MMLTTPVTHTPPNRRRCFGRLTPRLIPIALAVAVAGPTFGAAGSTVVRADFTATGKLPNLDPAGRVWSVAFDPGDPAIALAGTDGGVYRSADQGLTWTPTELTGTRVWQVGFDSRPGFAAYAGLFGKGIRRSGDGGKTWADSSKGLANLDVRSLAFGVDGIAAGTADGLDVSTDGAQWRPAGLSGYSVSGIAVAANAPEFTLIAGVDHGDSTKGFLFRTTGGSLTPEVLKDGLPDNAVISSVSAGPLPQGAQKRPLVVTSDQGTFHSIDGGTTWAASGGIAVQPTPVRLTCSTFSPADPNVVYAGSDAGGSSGGTLMRSVDGGATFSPFEAGLPKAHNVESIAVSVLPQPALLVALDPPNAAASIARGIDTTAPAAPPIAQEGAGTQIPQVVPTGQPTPAPRKAPVVAATPAGQSLARRIVNWPMPLSIELLVVLGIIYGVIRRRQRYLDVEGPP